MRGTKHDEQQCFALWSRFREAGCPDDDAVVRALVDACGFSGCDLVLENIGPSGRLDAWVVRADALRIALPLKSARTVAEATTASGDFEFWDEIGWFHPAYVPCGDVQQLRRAVSDAERGERGAVFARELQRIYPPVHLTTMLLQRYPELPEFTEFLPLIREATECFLLQRRRASIVSLLPVIEGLLSRFLQRLQGYRDDRARLSDLLPRVIRQEIERASISLVYGGRWVPPEYRKRELLERIDEYVWLLACFERFANHHLFARTASFSAEHKLNRHGILHGRWTDFDRRENFQRLWSILDMIAFALTMGTSGVSGFMPPMSAEAVDLAARLDVLGRLLQAITGNHDTLPARDSRIVQARRGRK